ncbi:MAG: hypothetical protein Sapg2KO_25240 [Saprospiraceae bacterium]
MNTLTLKTLLKKRKPTYQALLTLVDHLPGPITVTDPDDLVLLGPPNYSEAGLAIQFNELTVGKVYAPNASVKMVRDLLEVMFEKEYERREMGNEVLQLYREINLIYDFSEELASTIDPQEIGQLALQQARQLIHSDAGRVILIDEKEKSLKLLSQTGHTTEDQLIEAAGQQIIEQFLKEVKADIIQNTRQDERTRELPTVLSSLLYAPLKGGESPIGMILLGTREPYTYKANDLKILNTLALQTASAIESSLLYEKNLQEVQEREAELQRINEASRKFVPYDFIRLLGRESIKDIRLGDQFQKDVTVMFIDIRGYTTFSESMTPQENFSFLNSYIKRVGAVISDHGGIIMSFFGDGILALFLEDRAQALRGAVAIQERIKVYNQKRQKQVRQAIRIGIGMHYGSLIMGILGDERRQEANLVSDTVNTAARMEGLTKYYGASIIASETVLQGIPASEGLTYRSLGKVQVKGKKRALEIFDIFQCDPTEIFKKKQSTLPIFQRGLVKYNKRCFEEATAAFAQVLSIHPEDRPAQLYLNNAIKYHSSGVGTDWEGVEVMEIK